MDPTLDYGALINALFGGGTSQPPLVPTGLQAPGQLPSAPVPLMPPAQTRPIEPYMTDPLMSGSPTPPVMPQLSQPASLGAVLDPTVPIPRPRPAEAPGGTYAAQTSQSAVNDPSRLLNSLKGVVAPPPPVAQKVGTPHAPTMAKLQGGNVAELLASLGIGPQQAFPGLKLPSTLGQALGG
jgi:hypothetical protein